VEHNPTRERGDKILLELVKMYIELPTPLILRGFKLDMGVGMPKNKAKSRVSERNVV
jgi:hypothetical protein